MKNQNSIYVCSKTDVCSNAKNSTIISALAKQFGKLVLLLAIFCTLSLKAQITGDSVVCANSSIIYSYPFTTGYSYTWNSFGSAQMIPNTNSVVISWGSAGSGQVTLIVKDVSGNVTYSAVVNVTINPLPIPKIIPLTTSGCYVPPPIPPEGTVTPIDSLSATCYEVCDSSIYLYKAAYPDPNHSYVWSVIPSTAAISIVPGTGGSVAVQWNAQNSQVTLRLHQYNIITGCSDSIDMCIKIIPRPVAGLKTFPAAVSGTANVCLNATVGFLDASIAAPNSNITSWFWNFGDGFFSTAQNPSHKYLVPGTYLVKLRVENECHCVDSAEVYVKVDSIPGPDIYCVNTICENTTGKYCTSYNCSPYQWSVTNGTITGGSGTSCVDVQWGNTGPASIVLQGSTCVGSCAYATSAMVPILTSTAAITGPNPACFGSVNYYSVPIVPGTSYTWSITGPVTGTILSGQGSQMILVRWDTTGTAPFISTIKVSYGNAFLNCYGAAIQTIQIGPPHTILGPVSLCENDNAIYTSNSANAKWQLFDSGSSLVASFGPSAAPFTHNFTAPAAGAYLLYSYDQTGTLCASPDVLQIQVAALPPSPAAAINTVICPGQTYLYTGAPTSNNYYLKWYVQNGVPNQTSGNAISVTWGLTGPWTLSLTQVMVLPGSCESLPTVYSMGNPPPPAPPITGTNSTCWNKLEAYSTTAVADNYQWNLFATGFGSTLQVTSPQNVSVQFNNGSGTQTATLALTVTRCGASTTTTMAITIAPPPPPTISIPSVICAGQSANFSTPVSASSYSWTFGDGSPGAGGLSLSSVNHTYNNILPYVITLTVTDAGGCQGTAVTSSIVNVNPSPVANVTSPNQLIHCTNGAAPNVTLFASAQTISGTPVYSWAGPVTGTSNSLIANQVGTYTMYVTINGCVASQTVLVDTTCTNNSPCTFSVPGSYADFTYSMACSAVDFTPNIVGAGGQLLSWSFGDPLNSTSNLNNPSFTYLASGFYQVTLHCQFPAAGGGWCPFDTTIVVPVPIYADFKYEFSCGSGLDLNTTLISQSNWLPTTSIAGYTWTALSTSFYSTAPSPVASFTPGTYTVQLTIQETGSTVTCTQTKTLVVPQRPAASYTVVSPICEGNPLTFTPTVSSDIVKYVWDFGDGSGLITQNPNSNGIRTYTYQIAPYQTSLTITDIYGCTDTFGTINVGVKQNLFTSTNVAVSPNTGQFCQGDSIQLCAVSVNSVNPNTPYTYQWTTFTTTSCIYALETGSYGVVFTDSYGCRSETKYASVGKVMVPTPLISGKLDYCVGEDILFSIDKGPNYTYQWIYNFPSTLITSSCTSPLFPPVTPCSPITASSYTPIGTYTMQGLLTEQNTTLNCTALGPPIVYEIHGLPAPPTVGNSQCAPLSPVTLTSTGGPASTTNLWNTGAQGLSTQAISPGKYWASVVDKYGCKSIADTAYIWPLPDFNSLLTGCYDVCDTGAFTIYAPTGYTMYTWAKDGSDIASSTGTVPLNLTINANAPWSPSNSGNYNLTLTSPYGCSATSPSLEINVHPCDTCDLSIKMYTVYCVDDPDMPGVFNLLIGVNYSGAAATTFTMASSIPSTTSNLTGTLYPGLTDITATFVPGPGETHFCFTFTVGSTPMCVWDTCILIPPCNPPPCEELSELSMEVDCYDVDGNGNPIYNWGINFNAGPTGTLLIANSQGTINPTYAIVSAGPNMISGSFTDAPVYDGILCLDLYFFNGIDWCWAQICKELPLVPPCFNPPPPCNDIDLYDRSLVCYTVNAFGQPVYNMLLTMNASSTSDYSFYIISSSGPVGPFSPTIINSSSGVFTGTFVDVFNTSPGMPICFTIVATNTLTADQCTLEVCLDPEPCDPSYYRLINTVSVNLYPNPATDRTVVEYVMDDANALNEIVVSDLQGRVVLRERLQETKGKVELKTSGLPLGMYFVSARHDGRELVIKKLIIQQ